MANPQDRWAAGATMQGCWGSVHSCRAVALLAAAGALASGACTTWAYTPAGAVPVDGAAEVAQTADSATTPTHSTIELGGDAAQGAGATDALAPAADAAPALDGSTVLDGPTALDGPTVLDGPTALDGPTVLDGPTALDGPTVLDGPSVLDGSGAKDASAADTAPPTDAFVAVDCTPATQVCEGAKLATCGPKGDGWIFSNCFPGTTCVIDQGKGVCKPVSNNLVVMFDSSGSMTAKVKKKNSTEDLCQGNFSQWPVCEYDDKQWPLGCTRIGVSKTVFKQALAKIDEQVTRLALFRFPQNVNALGGTNCSAGAYSGNATLTGDSAAQSIKPLGSGTDWYWNSLADTQCVPFAKDLAQAVGTKAAILKWMDGKEAQPLDPELRATGGTPIGKTEFYIGEYLRNSVVVDGKKCAVDADCANVNYQCKASECVDPSRSCRDTVLVLFTDGGEGDNNSFFSPRVQAKRMSMGLACESNADCVGGSECKAFKQCAKQGGIPAGAPLDKACEIDADCQSVTGTCASFKQCMPKDSVSGWRCTATNLPCLPDAKKGEAAFCDPGATNKDSCVREPYHLITASAAIKSDNVLRAPNGKPFGVTVHVVDIGSISATELANSMRLAMAGSGKLLGTDASDPEQFLGALDQAFDLKNKKLCGADM